MPSHYESVGQLEGMKTAQPTSVLESDLSTRVRAQGRPWAEPVWDLPAAEQVNTPVASADPYSVLDAQLSRQMQQIESELGAQEGQVKMDLDQQLGKLEDQYNIERRYIEEAEGVDPQRKVQQIEQLNKKYELKLNDAQQQVQPALTEIEARRRKAMSDLQQRNMRAQMEIGVIDQMAQKMAEQGVVVDPAIVLQQKMQAAGVNVPVSMLRPENQVTPKQQLSAWKQDLRAVEDLLGSFKPATKGGVFGWGAADIQYSPTGYKDDFRTATPEEAQMMKRLETVQADLRKKIADYEYNAYRLSNAMNSAQDLRGGNPMASKAAELLQDSKPKANKRVKMRRPDGKVGTVPANQVQDAIASGYTLVGE